LPKEAVTITSSPSFHLDKRKLLFGTKGKDNETAKRFVADLEAHGGDPEKVTDAAIDMSKAFIKGSKSNCPMPW